MRGHRAPVRTAVGDHDPGTHGSGIPPVPHGDVRGEAAPLVHLPKQHANLDDLGLEFDHEEHATAGVPSKDVDDPAFAVNGEGNLGLDDPAIYRREHPGDRFVHRRVAFVEEPWQVSAIPSDERFEPCPERTGYLTHLPEWHRRGTAMFDAPDDCRRDAGARREVRLPPPFPDPDRPQHGTDPLVIHPRRMTKTAHLGLNRVPAAHLSASA